MDNGMWSVDTIVFSDDADTSLLVTPSGVAAAGPYTVELRNADVEFGSAFQFAFTCYPPPPPATIVRPLAGCGGTVARLPCCRNHCATWVMSESASNDLELLVLEVHDRTQNLYEIVISTTIGPQSLCKAAISITTLRGWSWFVPLFLY